MTEQERFEINVLNEEHWMIEDTLTGETATPLDGTTNVLKGLVSTMNKFYEEKQTIINTLQSLYENERTAIGKSVLKQAIEAIQ